MAKKKTTSRYKNGMSGEQMTIYLPTDLKELIREKSKEKQYTMSIYVRFILEEWAEKVLKQSQRGE